MAEEPQTPDEIKKPEIKQPVATPNTESKAVLPRIRTYAADMNRAIKSRGATLSTIVAAEKRTPKKLIRTKKETAAKRKSLLFGGGAIFLVLLGVAVIATVSFFFSSQGNPLDVAENIIFPNQTIVVDVGLDDVRERLATIREDTNMSLGEVARLVVIQNELPLAPQEMAIRLGFPSAFTREITDLMIGIHSFDRNQPFVIMEIAAYDRSFNALLVAEAELGRNLGEFFAPHNAQGSAPSMVFEDVIIRNVDVRQSNSVWPILYSYPERTLLVFTTNEFTLREIMSRLSNQKR